MPRELSRTGAIDRAAAALRDTAPAFTAKNLHFELRRAGASSGYEGFVAGPLARRLRQGPIEGLLPLRRSRDRAVELPGEYRAYFPAAVLVVDRRDLVELAVAAGLPVQGRIAVVSLDGFPATVVRWLRRGWQDGHAAPVGFLHDADTVVYPFAFEPLATFARARAPGSYVDLGLPPGGLDWKELPFVGFEPAPGARVRSLEEPRPASILAYAARRLGSLAAPDPWLRPLARQGRSPKEAR